MCVRTTLRVAKHVCEVRNVSLFGSKEQVVFRITVGLILMYCYVRHCSNEIVLQFSVKILCNSFTETTGADDSIILTTATEQRWQSEVFDESWKLWV